jgi:hypothetical protein
MPCEKILENKCRLKFKIDFLFFFGYLLIALMKLHWAPVPIFLGNAPFNFGSLMGLLLAILGGCRKKSKMKFE